jgi:cytochrome c biogenesis protein CcdA
MSNYKTVFFTLGILQIILGVSMFIPIIVQFAYAEIDSSFFGASIITIIFGTLFFLSNLDHDKKLNLQQAFLTDCAFLAKYCNFWIFALYIFNNRTFYNRCIF